MNSSIAQVKPNVVTEDKTKTGIWYVGFPGEASFVKLVNEYTALANSAAAVPTELIGDTLNAFMENALNHYFVTPLDTLCASDKHRKVVMVGVNTIRKAVGAVLRKVVAKMSQEDRIELGQYIGVMVVTPEHADHTMVIYPIQDSMAAQAKQLILKGRADKASDIKSDLISLLIEVNEEAMQAYFHIPFNMMSFGMVTRKLVTMTADASRTATQMVIKKVIAGLDEQEMQRMIDYVEALFIEGPAHSGPLQS